MLLRSKELVAEVPFFLFNNLNMSPRRRARTVLGLGTAVYGGRGRDGRSVRVKQAPRRLRLGGLALSKATCGGRRRTTVLTDYLLEK